MLVRTLFVTISCFIALPIVVLGTAQDPDVLIFDGGSYDLLANPLEDFYGNDESKRPKFWIAPNTTSSGNWRGYVATWQIVDNQLYLAKIDSWFCEASSRCRRVALADLFGKRVVKGRVYANWYSGKLRIPEGKQLRYVHSGYASIFERDIMFDVSAGKIVNRETIDNTQRELPSDLELMRQELARLKAKVVAAKPNPSTDTSESKIEPFLITEDGWGSVVVGAKRKAIEVVLGSGEHDGRRYGDVYFVEYPQRGVQISYTNKNDRAHAIFLYNKQTYYGDFVTPPVRTDKGITWSSSPDDVIKAYGEPPRDFADDAGGKYWRRLEYDKIDFRFEGGKMTRISLTAKNCTGCKD